MTGIEIRRMSPAEAEAFRQIRLEALQRNPEAYGSSFEQESAQPLAWFEDRLDKADVFGAFRGTELLGIAGYLTQEGLKHKHKGVLWGMYVRPAARNAGVGRALVEDVLEHAAKRVELTQLCVISANDTAKRLYTRHGFIEYGVEKNALKHNGCYYDDVLMAKPLTRETHERR